MNVTEIIPSIASPIFLSFASPQNQKNCLEIFVEEFISFVSRLRGKKKKRRKQDWLHFLPHLTQVEENSKAANTGNE